MGLRRFEWSIMCGIIGFVSGKSEKAGELLFEGLRTLEYRGYDSAGIAVVEGAVMRVEKEAGNLDRFAEKVDVRSIAGTRGIAHTRWATHGFVTRENAHPHLSCDGRIAVVHNGIIENFQELHARLATSGHVFKSTTDTEVIAHLIEEHSKAGESLKDSVLSAVRQLRGSFALLVASSSSDGIVAVKKESPLILGIADGMSLAASDPLPIVKYTDRVVFLDDGQAALLSPGKFECFDFDGTPLSNAVSRIDLKAESSQKGVFEHYMLKEILEQPAALRNAASQDPREVEAFASDMRNANGVMIVANGTAFHAAMAGQYLFDRIAGRHVNVVNASEFPYLRSSLHPGAVVIAISQSGETADVLAALREAKAKRARIFSIVNVVGSSIARMSERVLYTRVGPEIAVASTKAFTGQLCILYLLAYAFKGEPAKGFRLLHSMSPLVARAIESNDAKARELAYRMRAAADFYYIGRGVHYPLALEGALKMKEISYAHAEGMPAGELKHGTLALIDSGTPVVLINPTDSTSGDTLGNAMETKARGARIIAVSDRKNEAYDELFEVPACEEAAFYPLLCAIPLQLFAYYSAVARGKNPDRPRNLAKSVTVK
ncbi:MAG: glutamine--fructose-6-phosphate transaminase (isomerizing) [Candidatus Micrarchaeota archaeon]